MMDMGMSQPAAPAMMMQTPAWHYAAPVTQQVNMPSSA